MAGLGFSTASPSAAVASPAFPSENAGIPAGGGHFLPPYLLGGSTTHASPGRPGTSNIWSGRLGMTTPPPGVPTSQRAVSTPTSIKAKAAPPVEGLFDGPSPNMSAASVMPKQAEIGMSNVFSPLNRAPVTPNAGTSGAPPTMESVQRVQGIFTRHQSMSPAQVDPFYSQGSAISSETVLDDRWVTVFGFPVESSPYILQQFSQCGTIVRHVVACNCNWMHICYESPLQAKKALSKNGKVFSGSMMVAVQPCIEQSVMHEEHQQHPVAVASPAPGHSATPSRPVGGSMRPLTAAYRTSSDKYEVEPAATPQKSSNVLSKAVEYMFGW